VWCLHDDDNAKNEVESSDCTDGSDSEGWLSSSSEEHESESEIKQDRCSTPLSIAAAADSSDDE
jgi:hypothetical protein